MIFKDNKKFYRERKISNSTKRKLETDTLRKNMRNFTFEDIAKKTKISRKVQKDKPIKDRSLIPSYNVTSTIHEDGLSAYGTYLKNDKTNKDSKKAIKNKIIFKSNKKNKKRSFIRDKTKYASTIDEYITRQQLMKRKQLKSNKETLKIKNSTNHLTNTTITRKKYDTPKNRKRRILNQKKENTFEKTNNDDTIELLLKRIPTEK